MLMVESTQRTHVPCNEIVRDARMRLAQCPFFSRFGERISIQAQQGRLVLEGQVPSFYLKQVLQTTLRGIEGVEEIHNRVVVS